MNTRPLLGYVARSHLADVDLGISRYGNNETYANALSDNGGAPIMIPPTGTAAALDRIYDALDGLLLTGGPDVDPTAYGQAHGPLTDTGDEPMEKAEFALLRRALDDGKPVLGICRGLQVLNVALGGTLYQDLAEDMGTTLVHPAYRDGRSFLVHGVAVIPGSLLYEIVGRDEIGVNSLHHQGIHALAPTLTAVAVAPDGLVEAVERPDRPFVVAVQWHPEEMYKNDGAWAGLFRAFTEAAAAYRVSASERAPSAVGSR